MMQDEKGCKEVVQVKEILQEELVMALQQEAVNRAWKPSKNTDLWLPL